jgi:hypothetical protein
MPMQTGDQLNPLEMQNSGVRVPAIRLVKDNPKAAALVSKLVVDQRAQRTTDAMQAQGAGVNLAALRGISHEGMQNVNDHETIRQLLSDTDLAAAILVSVILSPKDMVGVEVGYLATLSRWQLPHEVNGTMVNRVRKYLDEVYKIKPRLPEMLEDILFRRGSYPVAVLPENAVDDLIHGNGSLSMESLRPILRPDGQIQSLGLLGPSDKEKAKNEERPRGYQQGIGLALEHLLTHQPNKEWDSRLHFELPATESQKAETLDPHVTVTDNIGILKMPLVSEKLRQRKMQDIVGRTASLSTEAIAKRVVSPMDMPKVTGDAIMARTFHRPNMQHTVVKEVKTQDKLKRRSVGMPLEIHFPSEAVIPVHVPNQPSKQIGFWLILDAEGNPINRGMGVNHYRQLGASLQNNSFSSAMIQRAGLAMGDNSSIYGQGNSYATAAQMYGSMLDRELKQRMRNGLVGGNVEIAGHEEVYNLMLARSMANQFTQLLFIPVEYMTYMAFEYNPNGTGRSLLENTKIIDSMQANLLVGTIMGTLRNAIGRTHVEMKLDEHTPDPMKAIEQGIGEMMRVNSNGFPLGTIDPLDIKEGLQRSAFEFSFTGSPKLPDMSVDFSEKNSNYQPPDSRVMEDLRKRRLMSFWLTPEMVDAATGADFARSVVNNSTLLSKRAMMLQQKFTPQVSAHIRKHIINSGDLVDDLIEILNENFDEIIKDFSDDEKIEMFDGTVVTKAELKDDPLVKVQFIRELIEDFVGGFSVTLPEPDTTKLENLGELYSKQSQLVEEAIKAWISPDMMDPAVVGEEVASHIGIVAAQMKAYLLRDWQIKNGLLPELTALTAKNEDGETDVDIAEIQAAHNASIMDIVETLLVANKKAKEKTAKALEKAGIEMGSTTSFGSDASSSSFGGGFGDSGFGSDSSSGSDNFGMGGDDFNFDMGGDTGGSSDPINGETNDTNPDNSEDNANAEAEPENGEQQATPEETPPEPEPEPATDAQPKPDDGSDDEVKTDEEEPKS